MFDGWVNRRQRKEPVPQGVSLGKHVALDSKRITDFQVVVGFWLKQRPGNSLEQFVVLGNWFTGFRKVRPHGSHFLDYSSLGIGRIEEGKAEWHVEEIQQIVMVNNTCIHEMQI